MTTPSRRSLDSISVGCSGDSCESVDPWPVHQIRHRNSVFLRLCTSCVLKHHPGSFCSTCFDLLDSQNPLPSIHCSKCPSIIHLRCLSNPSDDQPFLCPACDSPSPTSFSYFPFSKDSPDRIVDLRSAKILLTAARLSSASMNRAAAISRADAEKKVKEAGLARKRAREMLERSLIVSEQEKREKMEKMEKMVEEPLLRITAMAVSGNEKMKGKMNSEVGDEGVGKDEKGKKKRKKMMGILSDSQTGSGEQEE